MGVYVFRCLDSEWVKVGHHKITAKRPNVYYRIAGRGFYSCVHPNELKHRLSIHDVELIAWYPNLERRDERAIHNKCAISYGEFHSTADLPTILQEADRRDIRAPVSQAARNQAIAWAGKRCRCKSEDS